MDKICIETEDINQSKKKYNVNKNKLHDTDSFP